MKTLTSAPLVYITTKHLRFYMYMIGQTKKYVKFVKISNQNNNEINVILGLVILLARVLFCTFIICYIMIFILSYLIYIFHFKLIFNPACVHYFFQDPSASLDLVDFDETPDPVGNFSGYVWFGQLCFVSFANFEKTALGPFI